MHDFLPLLIGGLVLFLYSIVQLSEILTNLFTDKAREAVQKYTSNLFSSIILGLILTIILDSSSAVIILVIIFINAKTLTFRQAIGFIMGANIGTTFSSQIIAMDVGKYSVIPLFIGLILEIFVGNKKWNKYGNILLYFGMLFFGLFIMEEAVLPLKDSETFANMLKRVEGNPIEGALIGGLVTLVIQSSSGTVGMAIVLGKQNILSAAAGLAIMLGAELGTCSDTLIATVKGSRQAIKTGLFHLFFNLTSIILGLIFFNYFVSLTERITVSTDIGSLIANGHMLFNILGVLLFLPFVSPVEKLFNYFLPDKQVSN